MYQEVTISSMFIQTRNIKIHSQELCLHNLFGIMIAWSTDKEKYKEMLLDASESVLGIFGFDRTLFGKPKDKKWWMQLRRHRELDVKAETNIS